MFSTRHSLLAAFFATIASSACALTDWDHRTIEVELADLKSELPIRIDEVTELVALTYVRNSATLIYVYRVALQADPSAIYDFARYSQAPKTCVNLKDDFETGVSATYVYEMADGRSIGAIHLSQAICEQYRHQRTLSSAQVDLTGPRPSRD